MAAELNGFMQSQGMITKLNTLVASMTGGAVNTGAARVGLALLAGVAMAFAPSARGAVRTWNNTGTDFASNGSWNSSAPTSGDTGSFTSAATQNPNLSANRSIAGLNFSSTAGAYTLTANSGGVLTLGDQG